MSDFVVLRGQSNEDGGLTTENAKIFRDVETLLERIQTAPGEISCVSISADFEDRSRIVQQIREADSTVSVVLLGVGRAPADAVPDALRDVEPGESRALREMRQRALEAEKLASVTALTAGIAHDVGTPMTAILGYAELIAKSVGDEKNRKRATTIAEQVHRVSNLIETLVNLSRTEAGHRRPLELTDILDRALDFYREKFKHHGVEVERHYDRAPQILGDPARLHQVLLSLFLNALEAMADGGMLRVSLAETDAGDAQVRVSDTGPAIAPDLQARIFEPGSSTNQRASGRGLGLRVAKTIVEEHGGTIALTSELDLGTEFRLIFPRMPEKPDR